MAWLFCTNICTVLLCQSSNFRLHENIEEANSSVWMMWSLLLELLGCNGFKKVTVLHICGVKEVLTCFLTYEYQSFTKIFNTRGPWFKFKSCSFISMYDVKEKKIAWELVSERRGQIWSHMVLHLELFTFLGYALYLGLFYIAFFCLHCSFGTFCQSSWLPRVSQTLCNIV